MTGPRAPHEVVVVGAGMSGLAAADELVAAGVDDIVVLEAGDRVGGRLKLDRVGELVVDGGGQYIGAGQDEVWALCRRYGFVPFETHTGGHSLFDHGGRRSRFDGNLPEHAEGMATAVEDVFAEIDALGAGLDLEAPWASREAMRADALSVQAFLDGKDLAPEVRAFFDIALETTFATTLRDLSLLYVAWVFAGGGGGASVVGTTDGAQSFRLREGAASLADALADELGERVVLDTPVVGITRGEDGIATVHAEGGRVRRARHVVVALPPALCARIRFQPRLPVAREQLHQRIPMGVAIKCVAVYPEPFWQQDGLDGQALVAGGPATWIYDNGFPDDPRGVLVGFVTADHAVRLAEQPPERREAIVLGAFAEVFGEHARRPLHYKDWSWAQEPWALGCYTGILPPGVLTRFGPALREPVGPLHWAGTETAVRWSGFFDGALSAGRRAAREILELR